MAHNEAEVREHPPKRKEDQMVVYGPDHKIIQVKSPEEATLANLLGDAVEEGDEVEEVLLQSQEERIATIRRKNEARRESFLARIQLPVMSSSTRPVVAESALIPSPTQDSTVGEVQPMVIDQGQSSETVAMTADPVSLLVPRAHTRRIKPKRPTIIPPPPPPPPQEQQNVEMTQMSQEQAIQIVVANSQGQLDGDAKTMDQQLSDPAATQADVDPAPLVIDQEMQDETATVATEAESTSEGLPLAALVDTARRQRVEEIAPP